MCSCSDLLCGALFPVGGRGGCDVTYGGGGVRAVASGCGAGLRGDGGGRHVADQPRAAVHPDVRVPLCGHVEDAEPVVVESRQLALEHTRAPLAAADPHRRLAVEDGQLATYARKQAPNTHTQRHARKERWTDTREYSHTHIHTGGHIRAYIHTQECLSVTQSTTPKPW